jgi:hypothetical protein
MFQQIGQFIAQHQVAAGAVALWSFSALIHTMPAPEPTERWYAWLYNFAQSVGANLSKVGQYNFAQSVGANLSKVGQKQPLA